MAVDVVELFDSRQLRGVSTLLFKYLARGSTDIEAIADAVVLASPTNYGYYKRQWLDKTMTPLGGGVWNVEIPYGLGHVPQLSVAGSPPPVVGGGSRPTFTLPGEEDPLPREWSFDFSQTTRRITKSIKYFGGVDWNGDPFPPESSDIQPDIGENPYVDGDADVPRGAPLGFDPNTGEVEGIDVPDFAQRINVQAIIPVMTLKYRKLIEELSGSVNSETFLTRARGQVLFVGCHFGYSNSDGITGTYTFDVKRNAFNVRISNQMSLPVVRGWDYLEVFHDWALKPEGPEGAVQKKPRTATIHQVLPYADLNRLFTGT